VPELLLDLLFRLLGVYPRPRRCFLPELMGELSANSKVWAFRAIIISYDGQNCYINDLNIPHPLMIR